MVAGDVQAAPHVHFGGNLLAHSYLPLRHTTPVHYEAGQGVLGVSHLYFTLGSQDDAAVPHLAAGLPIVASDDPIRRSIVGRQGIYVNPQNISQVIRGINLALTKGKINYAKELVPYQPETILAQLTKEFHALIE